MCGMTEPQAPNPDTESERPETDSERARSNVVLLVLSVIVVGIGIWLVTALDNARKADECMSQGRRNCAPIDAPR
jgi:hypothetical protein